MGHAINYLYFDGKTSKKQMEAEANERARCDGDYHHSLDQPIRWYDNVICEDLERAMEFIKSHDKGWYDQLAVQYRVYPKAEPSKTLLNLESRRKAEAEKYAAYAKAHSVSTFKAEFVGCPSCGSKLKRILLRGESCPLCRAELRSKTTVETLERYSKNILELDKQIKGEQRKLQEKIVKKSEVHWLVKIEYHC